MASVAFFYFLLFPALYYYSRKPSRYLTMNKLRRVWGGLSSAFVGIFYKITYEVPLDISKTYIICPNHTSNLDITAVSLLLKGNFSFMGKAELTEGIVTRLFFSTVDIPVNRASKIASFRAFKRAMENLQNGTTMVIFPEGRIPDDYPPRLHPFKNGAFRLAIEAQAAIVPITMTNNWQILWDTGTKYGSRPGICNIFVHKPIETIGMSIDDADSLRDEVHKVINHKFAKYDHR